MKTDDLEKGPNRGQKGIINYVNIYTGIRN